MNPFEWFDDDERDYRYGGPYGPYAQSGPYGWGGPYRWGGPWSYPGYGRGNTVIVVPQSDSRQASADLPE
jgi:hypothetical protein